MDRLWYVVKNKDGQYLVVDMPLPTDTIIYTYTSIGPCNRLIEYLIK